MAKKIVVKVELNCTKCKRRAMLTTAKVEGVDSIDSDDKNNLITVTGDADPVILVECLREFGFADLVSVGPKEPEKKADDKKADDKKPDEKKETQKKAEPAPNPTYVVLQPYPYDSYPRYNFCSDENPNSCCIT